jgi:antirestriction protein ArdC
MAFDIYAAITDRIIAELENGIIPWEKPWAGTPDGAVSYATGKPYSVLNQILLGKPGEYLTFKQIQEKDGKIKKGAKANMVVFWKFLQKTKDDGKGGIVRDSNGLPVYDNIPFLRYYNVYHIDDVEGIEKKHTKDVEQRDNKPIDEAQKVLEGYWQREGITVEHVKNSDRAYYRRSDDLIHLPEMGQFKSAEAYYDTAFHESVHITGHEKRLNRLTTGLSAAFGGEDYSKEELCAEIGACSIMHQLGLETDKTFRNTASYIQSWLRALKNDKRMIVSAAGKAEKAVDLIFNRQKQTKAM